MCYICVARGNVGTHYKEYQKAITVALRAVGRPSPSVTREGACFGDGKDWTKIPPKGKRAWDSAQLTKGA